MENSEIPQNKEKSSIGADESYKELRDFIVDAAKLDEHDQKKIAEIKSLNINGEEIDWTYFSVMAMQGLLHGYKHGELSFEEMMKIAWCCVLPLRTANQGFITMGALAAIAVKIKPKEKNAKKPPFPTWVKTAAIQLALLIEKADPKIKLSPSAKGIETVSSKTLKQLNAFGLNIGERGKTLTEKTVYEWVREYKRGNGLPLKTVGSKQ